MRLEARAEAKLSQRGQCPLFGDDGARLRERLLVSGVWYRLTAGEQQITSGAHPTYGDLVRQYIVLNKMQRFERVPHGRYIYFVADFLEADKTATRAEAIAAWKEVKELDVPKDYVSWVKHKRSVRERRSNTRGIDHLQRFTTG